MYFVYFFKNTILSLDIFLSNLSFIEFIIVCSLVLITSYILNPRFFLRLHDLSAPQSIIIFIAKSICKNVLFGCFTGLSINSCLLFFVYFITIVCDDW